MGLASSLAVEEFGQAGLKGRRPSMEDAIAAVPVLESLELNSRISNGPRQSFYGAWLLNARLPSPFYAPPIRI